MAGDIIQIGDVRREWQRQLASLTYRRARIEYFVAPLSAMPDAFYVASTIAMYLGGRVATLEQDRGWGCIGIHAQRGETAVRYDIPFPFPQTPFQIACIIANQAERELRG